MVWKCFHGTHLNRMFFVLFISMESTYRNSEGSTDPSSARVEAHRGDGRIVAVRRRRFRRTNSSTDAQCAAQLGDFVDAASLV